MLATPWQRRGCGAAARGLLLAIVGFAAGLGVHRAGFVAGGSRPKPVLSEQGSVDAATEEGMSREPARPFDAAPRGPVIDAEYRVVS